MRKFSFRLFLLVLALALAACGEVKADLTSPLLPALEVPAAQPAATATLVVEQAAAEPAPVDECVACHSDKDLLIEVAEPEVEAEPESKGTG